MQTIAFFTSFIMICLASYLIGKFFTRLGLPYITGYLLAGALAGPFLLDLMPGESVDQLRFVDQLSLAVIAFVAGSELYLKEIRSRLRGILFNAGGIFIVTFMLCSLTIFLLTQLLPFTQSMSLGSRLVVALLGGTVLLALSPPSTIAVIKEVRAKGPFTQTILGVTVSMDVLIIVFFAISSSIAEATLNNTGLDILFIGLLIVDLTLAVGLGYGAGRLLQLILFAHWQRRTKIVLTLLLGYSIYLLADLTKAYSLAYLSSGIYIEPLLIAMIAGFFVINYTPHRGEFEEVLHQIGPAVYVAFFTLTGISLKLDILLDMLPFAIALFVVRALGIFIGSFSAGTLVGEPARFKRIVWMSYITQAGIALGLAREVSVSFPTLGDAFATLIISVIVLNEIFGPLFLKEALRRAGETHLPQPVTRVNEVRKVLIVGIEAQTLTLARQLQREGWQGLMADPDQAEGGRLAAEDVEEYFVPKFSRETLTPLLAPSTDALVAMLEDDYLNLKVCELAREHFGATRLVVRLNGPDMIDQFQALGALVVDPASAMINLLDQAVRAPQTTTFLLHQDSDREIIQITINNTDVDNLFVRDIRLPNDVLLLDITRNGQSIVPSGYTRLRLEDEVTLLGPPESLNAATLKLGY